MNIKVGHIAYQVVDSYLEVEEERCGVTYKQQSIIHISKHLSPDVRRETLLHEVQHACAGLAGINNEETLNEEAWINRITPVLLLTLQENPHLVKELNIHES